MKILVVDDDPVILSLVPAILRQEGHYDICVAASGNAAMEILSFSNERFDVLILDIEMPEMNGIQLCENIRKIPDYRRTPIIMLTAKSDSKSIESAFSAGANDYITKPFDVKAIGTRIQIAERMMRDSCKFFTVEALPGFLPEKFGSYDFDAADAVMIQGLEQHTDPFSLGNYLSQLARDRIDETSVFALRINAFDILHDEFSGRDALRVLAEVSRLISAVTSDKRLLDAYIGSGVFMCIATDDLVNVWLDVEDRIDTAFRQLKLIENAGLGDIFSITMGRPIRPNSSKTQRVRPTFDRALMQLDKRNKINLMAN
jgi:DNA-binding response OmpR family regulator